MVTRFGMVTELGAVAYDAETSPFLTPQTGMMPQPRWYSEATAAKMDAAILGIIDAAFGRARAILEANQPLLESTAHKLLERETLGSNELEPLARRVAMSKVA